MDHSADRTEGLTALLDGDLDGLKVLGAEVPSSMLWVGIDLDGHLDLTFEVIKLSCVLALGKSVGVAGHVLDNETVLFEDVLALGGIAKVIVPKSDTANV